MVIEPLGLLFLSGITVAVGYIGHYLFERTMISEALWLLLFGLLIGPVFGIVDRTLFMGVAPVLTTLSLILIVFDGGLYMDFERLFKTARIAVVMAFSMFLLITISVSLISVYFFGISFSMGLVFGAILGVNSTSVVIPMVKGLYLGSSVKDVLSLETILIDPIIILIVMQLVQVQLSNTIEFSILSIGFSYPIAAVTGIVGGFVWAFGLKRFIRKELEYMLVLAVIILLYVATEGIGGSGMLSVLLFGIIVGQSKLSIRGIEVKDGIKLEKESIKLSEEVLFFVKSFFFVFLGIMVTTGLTSLIYGLLITGVIAGIRIGVLNVIGRFSNFNYREIRIMEVIIPRGLMSAILAQIPVTLGLLKGDLFVNITFVVIMASIVYSTIGIKLMGGEK